MILNASDEPGYVNHGVTGRGEQRGVVGVLDAGIACGGIRGLEQMPRKALRRLRGDEIGPIDRLDDIAARDALERVDHRQRRDHADVSGHGIRDRVDLRRRGQGTGGVVDEHGGDVAPQSPQTCSDRILPVVAADDDTTEIDAFTGGRAQLALGIPLVPRGRDDDHLRRRRGEDAVESMTQHGTFVDADERFRRGRAQARSRACRDDDDRRRRHR